MINRPPFKEFPALKTEHLLLREITNNDINDLIEISVYDNIYAQTYDEAKKNFEIVANDYYRGDTIHWGIASKKDNFIIGTCGYYRGFELESGEIGYILKQGYQGKGLMTEAITAILNFGWQVLELRAVYAITEYNNEKSLSLLKRLNFFEMVIPDIEFKQFKINSPFK